MPAEFRSGWLLCALISLGACGGSDGGTQSPPPPIEVSVTPERDTVTVGTSTQLSATVSGSSNTQVHWSVAGGAGSGSVTAGGLYTAGTATGTMLVVAASAEDPTSTDTARVLVAAAPGGTLVTPDSVAKNSIGVSASITPTAGATYEWAATGGNITAGQGTAGILLTAGVATAMEVHCTVRNLADSSVTLSGQTVLVAGPAIVSFVAVHDTVINGQATSVTATFTDGSGAVSPDVGVVTSGVAVGVGPFLSGYAGTVLTLTVTGFRGATATADVRVVSVNPPVLNLFRAIIAKAPLGGRAQFLVGWNQDPGVTVSITPDVGAITSASPLTPILATLGSTLYTVKVQAPGTDSAVSDTVRVVTVAPASGQFIPTGSMRRARMGMTATLLNTGKVLISGGGDFSNGPAFASAEVYDPGAGTFAFTDSMTGPRAGSVASRVPDGRIFVASGVFENDHTTEFYDAGSGTWSSGPALTHPIEAGVTLSDGRVLLIPLRVSDQAEVFDPATGTISLVGAIPDQVRASFGLVATGTNRALIIGGLGQGVSPTSVLLFDGSTGQFTPTGDMHFGHYGGTYTRLTDGRVLVAGGYSDLTFGLRALAGEVYDPATGQWTVVGNLAIPRHVAGSALLADGKVLISGGLDLMSEMARYAEIFDPATGQFTPTQGNVTSTFTLSNLVRLQNGAVLIVGGPKSPTEVTAAAELFQP